MVCNDFCSKHGDGEGLEKHPFKHDLAYKGWWISIDLFLIPKLAEALSVSCFDFPLLCEFAGPAVERSNQTAATEHQAGGDHFFVGGSVHVVSD